MRDRWIQKVHPKKGALSRQLHVPIPENIPVTLLRKIVNTPIGKTIGNPTMKGIRRIKVTKLLKDRALFALNVRSRYRKYRR